ncbi:acyl-CoA dehydrogenase family protein [Nocardia fusca]|uniref:acyl-CoA dehydrogenase family protein n=1 Tax=Nocardia fusca TaxID=941183 RepID=UPI0007A73B85|nr:acyl-CoA dehydrogenase family protein [Nocardia fusca]
MDFTMGATAAKLRGELRRLITDEVPADYLGAFTDDPADLAVAQRFCATLADRGLLCLAWPEEFGGRGASTWEQTVVREEMWAHHEPRGGQYMGVNWVGPTIMRHGTPEQQRKHLPPIARGEVVWCQGFSEPEAGSDLASLRTTARHDGDGWAISGQKIWTSYASMAQWCFLLARTSNAGRKQQGLTVFLLPMTDPGITVRPIASMLGPHHLNEVFFDGVRATEAEALGEVDHGWSVVQEVLAFERVGIARYARCERLLHAAPEVLGESWDEIPEALRGRWARMLTRCRRARLLAYQVLSLQSSGTVAPGDAAAYRIAVTRLDQESAEVLVELAAAVRGDSETRRRFRRAVHDHWRYANAATVASGSIEVQRILLARELLAAPGSGRERATESAAGAVRGRRRQPGRVGS